MAKSTAVTEDTETTPFHGYIDPIETTESAPVRPAESRYTVDELAESSDKFGVSKECVRAAFRIADKRDASVAEAEEIIRNFMRRTVV
jgi:hypothetical protein